MLFLQNKIKAFNDIQVLINMQDWYSSFQSTKTIIWVKANSLSNEMKHNYWAVHQDLRTGSGFIIVIGR